MEDPKVRGASLGEPSLTTPSQLTAGLLYNGVERLKEINNTRDIMKTFAILSEDNI